MNVIVMKKIFFIILSLSFYLISDSFAKENFFEEAKNKYDKDQIEDSKFLFQRNIVFNPKDADSYLYLAKIYKIEEDLSEEEKNLNTTLLLDPKNEEALILLIDMELNRSNFSKVKELRKKFNKVCLNLCEKISSINTRLKEFEKKDAS